MRSGDREIPYSLVTAIDLDRSRRAAPGLPVSSPTSLRLAGRAGTRRALAQRDAGSHASADRLNDWAARDLAAKVGDPLTLEYACVGGTGSARHAHRRLRDRRDRADRRRRGRSRSGAGLSRHQRQREACGDWDPPFPIDLRRVAPCRRGLLGQIPDDAEGVHRRWRSGSRSGARATAIGRRSASRRRRASRRAGARDRFAAAAARSRSIRSALGVCRAATCAPRALAASSGATDFGE